MEKKIEDYLHLYMGCLAITVKTNPERIDGHIIDLVRGGFYSVKPILRPLSDMTEHECNMGDEILEAFDETDHFKVMKGMANMTMLLLKQGFDLFDLIPAGLAIDKTTLK